jgi:hypothetical protein
MPSLIPRRYAHLNQIWHERIGPALGRFCFSNVHCWRDSMYFTLPLRITQFF